MSAAFIAGVLLMLAGCLFEGGEAFPDLTKGQVAGCWKQVDPATVACSEQCFDSSYAYYTKDVDKTDTSLILERSGTYDIKANSIGATYKIASTRDPASIDSGSNRVRYALKGGSLVMLLADGKSLTDVKYIRSDATDNCGSRWRLFAKPPGWITP